MNLRCQVYVTLKTYCSMNVSVMLVFVFVGVDVSSMHAMKTQRPSTMLSDVRQIIATGGSLNQPNDDKVTLVCQGHVS